MGGSGSSPERIIASSACARADEKGSYEMTRRRKACTAHRAGEKARSVGISMSDGPSWVERKTPTMRASAATMTVADSRPSETQTT